MANVKISQLTAKAAKVESDDRIPIADFNGSTYDTKYVTGAQINKLELDTTPKLGGNLDTNNYKIISDSDLDVIINPNGTGNTKIESNLVLRDTAGATAKEILFYEGFTNGTNYVALKAPNTLSADTTYTLPTADGTSGQVLQTNGSGTLSWFGPKKYVALLTQTGTSAPTATVLENTLSGTPTLTRTGIGTYELTLTNEFTANKTWVVGGSADNNAGSGDFATLDIKRLNANKITLNTYDSFTPADDMLVSTSIEIRVYP
jgi:hypothetical protein